MTELQLAITVGVMIFGTVLTRAIPFLIFREKKPVPEFVTYLGKVLPCAAIGMLIVYCLQDTSVIAYPHGIPELISIVVIALLHIWRKNVLLSVGVGTVLYMILIQFVFI